MKEYWTLHACINTYWTLCACINQYWTWYDMHVRHNNNCMHVSIHIGHSIHVSINTGHCMRVSIQIRPYMYVSINIGHCVHVSIIYTYWTLCACIGHYA